MAVLGEAGLLYLMFLGGLDLDLEVPDSGSIRLTVNPTAVVSMQVSTARLDEPEEHEEGVSVRRTTASITGTGTLGTGGAWSATAIWGRNDPSEGPATSSYLAEATLELDSEHAVFGRVESLRTTGQDLELGPGLEDQTFPVLSASVGYLYTFTRIQDQEVAVGIRATANRVDPDLRDFYGDPVEYGFVLYLRLKPAKISATGRHP